MELMRLHEGLAIYYDLILAGIETQNRQTQKVGNHFQPNPSSQHEFLGFGCILADPHRLAVHERVNEAFPDQ
jgi:hypothetical protein